MEFDPICPPALGPGQYGSDRELFARVWRRVMPEDLPGCPIIPDEVENPDNIVPSVSEPAVSCSAPAVPEPVPTPEIKEPSGSAQFFSDSAVLFQRFIRDELSDHQRYTDMARQADRTASRLLLQAAADELRHARRLSTAFFLTSGVRYWPVETVHPRSDAPLPAALRDRFLAEQEGEGAYRAAAAAVPDTRLRVMFLELADKEHAHIGLILDLLEQQ
ncbi:MAG: ferritin-like domain-containing protein [Intestinimonas sp.]|jgi:hypothetical protein|nr:ferritin-like domain-containing protein [Intestinimonas sp.]